jgi:hypothetical protein
MYSTFTANRNKFVQNTFIKLGTKIFAFFIFLFLSLNAMSQTPSEFRSGDFTPPNNWGSQQAMSTVAGTNFLQPVPNATGNKYFRFRNNGSNVGYGPTSGGDIQMLFGTKISLQSQTGDPTFAYFVNVTNTSWSYIFKTNGSGNPGTSAGVAFEVQAAAPITISSTSQTPLAASVIAGENTTVNATLSAALPTGQGAYMRFTKDAYATSTVIALTGSGTAYSGTIPGSFNTAAANVSYYLFTSGNGLTISGGDADLFTINLLNNGGSNYSYTVNTPADIYLHNFGTTTITTHPYTVAPGTFASNLSSSSWTNSTSAFTSFAGSAGQAIALNNSGGTPTITLTFTIASGFSLSVTSFNFWRQRSTAGAQNWSMTINGIAVGSGTAPTTGASIGQSNVTNTVSGLTSTATIVLSLSGASGAGTFRLDDFNLKGTVTALPGPPTLTTPTASTITENSALLGATVTNNGGSSLTARGTSYKTSSPVIATDNQLAEGGTAVSTYTHTRSGLAAQTQYFYVGYATNASSTGISSEGNFRTLSNPPTAQATALSGTPISSTQIDLSWTAGTFPGTGATQYGYLIVSLNGGSPTLVGAPNGLAPASAVATGTIVSSTATNNPTLPATTASATGLSSGTTYNFLVVPYTWDGTNSSTYNYYTTSAATASATTSAGSPTVTTPTATSITENSAVLGATVTSDGGSSLTARGTSYKTSSPVVASDNQLAEGGTAVATYSHTRSPLSPETEYFYLGYATNASATGISSEGSFRTLSNPATVQATSLTATALSSTSLSHTWSAATFPGSGATVKGYVLLRANSPTSPSLSNTNGAAPVAGAGTTIVSSAIAEGATSHTTTGLTVSVTYNFVLIPFTWDGTNATTYNYLTAAAPAASGTPVPITYTYIGSGTSSWATPGNWSPSGPPGTGDGALFNGSSAVTVTNVPSISLKDLSFTGTGEVTLQASGAAAITIAGGTSPQFNISSGSSVIVAGTSAITMAISASNTGSISGSLKFQQGGAHRLTAASASGITFNSGGVFHSGDLVTTGYGGTPFGNGTANSVVFASGSTFNHNEGSNPFNLGQPASIVVFNSGSLYKLNGTITPSVSGRTYANFEYNNAATLSLTGASSFMLNNLTVSLGTLNVNVTGTPGHAIKGDISVAGGATLNFSPSSAGTFNFNSGASQTISGAGTLSTASNSTLLIASGTTVNLQKNISIGGTLSVLGTINCVDENIISGSGTFSLAANSTIGIGSANGIASILSSGNVQTTLARNFLTTANYTYNGSVAQITGTGLPASVNNLIIANTAPAAVTLSVNNTVNGTLLLNTGSLDLNGLTLTMNSSSAQSISGIAGNTFNVVGAAGSTLALSGASSHVLSLTNFGTALSANLITGADVNVQLNTDTQLDCGGNGTTTSMLTVLGTFTINSATASNIANSHAPFYGSGSTLSYNANYGRFSEWVATSGVGYPYNVTIQSGVSFDLSANGFADRAIAGSLNVIGNFTLGAMTTKLTVGGNVTVDGTLTLSTAIGGDIYLGGNWLRQGAGSFVSNARAIFFNGASGNQTITRAGGETFDYLFVDKAAGSVVTASDLTLNQDVQISNGTLEVGTGTMLDMLSNQVIGTGNLLVNGTFKTSKAAGFSGSASTAAMNTLGSITLGTSSTVDYASAGSQTITAGNYANLSNSGNGTRTLDISGTIGISAALTPGSGNYTIGTSTVEFNGSAAQSIPALPVASGGNYNNLTLNNAAGASLSTNVNLQGALTLTSGAFNVNSNTFTLLSSATQTARIAPVTGGSFVGDVAMQRFVPGGTAGWATIGMPVSGSTLAAWNDDIITSGYNGSTVGTGTFISVYSYDETQTGLASNPTSYIAATDATNSVDAKKGYFVFVADNATTVADKNLDVTGPPLVGTQNLNVSFTTDAGVNEDGWNLVSNPYCSAIDWLAPSWTKTNMDDAIYIYDTDVPQYRGSVGGVSYNGGNELIASSQSFFVHANAAAPSLIAQETVKTASSPVFYRSSNSTEVGVLRLQLDGVNGAYADETVFRTKIGATSNFDGAYDAYKLYSFDPSAPNISSKVNGIEYVVNAVDELTSNLDLPIRVNINTAGTYTINFKGLQNYRNISCLSFEDKLTQTSLDLLVDSSYSFTSALDTASASPRFVLHFGVEAIVPSVTPSATTVGLPGNATVNFANTSTGANSYSWNFGDGSPLETGASPSHTYTTPGIYTVILTSKSAAGCSETATVVITVQNVTSVRNIAGSENVSIVRDAQGVFANYNFAGTTKVKVNIYNLLGAQVGESQTATVQRAGRLAIKTPELAKGLYTIEVLFDNKKITRKLDF